MEHPDLRLANRDMLLQLRIAFLWTESRRCGRDASGEFPRVRFAASLLDKMRSGSFARNSLEERNARASSCAVSREMFVPVVQLRMTESAHSVNYVVSLEYIHDKG